MIVREPIVAGQFYPAAPQRCRAELTVLLQSVEIERPFPKAVAGLVPHAGWVCSGAVAAEVFKVLADARIARAEARGPEETAHHRSSTRRDVIVLFGGVHRYRGKHAAMFGSGRWETPLGPVHVDDRLAERIMGHTNLIVDDPYAHEDEHSLEVQMPFIAHLFPGVKVVPIMVPIHERAGEVGEAVGRTLTAYGYDALIVGTTDLTHYGPGYGFVPQGAGEKALAWAKNVNDRRFVDRVLSMQADELVPEATAHGNACNSGAAAATITAAKALGATEGVLLEHTTSSEVLRGRSPAGASEDSVGYAGIVFV